MSKEKEVIVLSDSLEGRKKRAYAVPNIYDVV